MKKNTKIVKYQNIEYSFDYIYGLKRLRIPNINHPQIQDDIKKIREITDFYPDYYQDNTDIKIRNYIIQHNLSSEDLQCKNKHCTTHVKFNSYSKGFVDYCSPFCANTSDNFQNSSRETRIKNGNETHTNINNTNNTNFDKWKNRQFIIDNFIVDDEFHIYKFQNYFNCSNASAYKHLKTLNIKYTKKVKQSLYELEIIDFLKSLGVKTIYKNNKSLFGVEVDIILPDYNIGIEFNGLMFHSHGISKYSIFNNPQLIKDRHLKKTELLESKDFQLLQIFENEWMNKKDIWKSSIKNIIQKSSRIYARKCSIKEVLKDEAYQFLKDNHLQGTRNSKINIGLFYNDKLVSLMTFGNSYYNKNYQYELIRFCNILDHSVIGGASKLLTYFERTYKPKSLISYANRRWSTGHLYRTLNFKFLNKSNPNYFYFKPPVYGEVKLLSRLSFQKNKLKNKLEYYDDNCTEYQNMFNNKYRLIYDCGNLSYIKNYI